MHSLCLIAKSNFNNKTSIYRKGYINNEDLKEVFKLLGETVTDDEVNSKFYIIHDSLFLAMIKIAGVKSSDKINFKEFVDFFNKVD
jgi:Ca2+-binding EF-hand superfamily protein